MQSEVFLTSAIKLEAYERKIRMDMRGKRQASSTFGGMGFYIALLVCVVAAGVVGYFALLNEEEEPDANNDPLQVVNGTENELAPVNGGEKEPVDPVLSREPVTVPPTTVKPELPEEDAVPVGNTEPEPEPEPEDEPEEEVPVSGGVTEPEDKTPEPEKKPVSSRIVMPLVGNTVAVFSADRLMYDATLDDWRTHDGIDISAEAGTQVVAATAGTVVFVGENDRLGVNIVIEHAGGYVTTYASLHPETLVSVGDSVDAGDVIGTVGNTSLNEAGLGTHLHFSVTRNGELIDPEAYLPKES